MWGTWCPILASTPPSSRMSQTATCTMTCSIMGYCLLSFVRIHPDTFERTRTSWCRYRCFP
eukprot:285580-Heterocapsa_arctica.AAC.1